MKGVYLCCYKAVLPEFDLSYNDISNFNGITDLLCSCLDVDLSKFDYILASPPCNYYSKANYRRDISKYSLETKVLLPSLIEKCSLSGKPFIIENVRNSKIFSKEGIYLLCDKYNVNIYEYGRHTYFTNCFFDMHNIPQSYDFKRKKYSWGYGTIRLKNNCQGGENVNNVFRHFVNSCVL